MKYIQKKINQRSKINGKLKVRKTALIYNKTMIYFRVYTLKNPKLFDTLFINILGFGSVTWSNNIINTTLLDHCNILQFTNTYISPINSDSTSISDQPIDSGLS